MLSHFDFRTRLTLGFAALLLIVVVLGAYGTSLLARLGPAIDRVMHENYRSVVAMQDIQDALERMDSGALYALNGETELGLRLYAENDPRVDEALQIELGNITIAGERERALALERQYAGFEDTLVEVLDTNRPIAARREVYFDQLLPQFQAAKGSAREIIEMNQSNMARENGAARRQAANGRRTMLALVLAATLLAVILSLAIAESILRPIRRMRSAAVAVREGRLDVVLPVEGEDEIARLSEAFNAMAAHLRMIQRSDHARLVRTREATQMAIDALPDGVAVLSPEGEVELVNSTATELFAIRPGSRPEMAWILEAIEDPRPFRPGEPLRLDRAVQVMNDGEDEQFFLPRAIPIRGADRLIAGTILLLHDVTRIREAYELQAELLQRVAHSIASPLTSLRMAIHLLLEERQGALEPRQIELLVAARDEAERLSGVCEELLSVQSSGGA
jgi:HAMP domain-containing protein